MKLIVYLFLKSCSSFVFSGTIELSGEVVIFKRNIEEADFETHKRFCDESGKLR